MRRWQAGLIIISTTFFVTLLFIGALALVFDYFEIDNVIRLPLLIVASVIGLLGAVAFVVVAFALFRLIDGREALGLPPGSVRAVLALLILVIFATMTVFFFSVIAKGTPSDAAVDLAKQVLTVLGTLLTAISSFYFGSRTATEAAARAGGANRGGNGGGKGSAAGGGGGGESGEPGGGGGGAPIGHEVHPRPAGGDERAE